MTEHTKQIYGRFHSALWGDASDQSDFPGRRPLLAHYTTMSTAESMLRNGEVWLANPLFMNDFEEMRFGLTEAANCFYEHRGIADACGGPGERHDALINEFSRVHQNIANEEAFDTYCMCFSEHDPEDNDGLLSMWRGYGANGSGVALVFDTARIPSEVMSPLVLARVHYASSAERRHWIVTKLDQFAEALQRESIEISQFYLPVHALLQRLKVFALYSKHHGFKEEREWRVVYLKDRDRDGHLKEMFGYFIRGNTIEPKLKLRIDAVSRREPASPVYLHELIERIILGPSSSSLLSVMSMKRMLEVLGREHLCNKVFPSTTPYRAV